MNREATAQRLAQIYEDQKAYAGLIKLYSFLISKGSDQYRELARVYDEQKLTTLARMTRMRGVKFLEAKVADGTASYYDFDSLARVFGELKQNTNLESAYIAGLRKFPHEFILTAALAESYKANKKFKNAVDLVEECLPYISFPGERTIMLEILRDSYKALNRTKDAARVEEQLSALK